MAILAMAASTLALADGPPCGPRMAMVKKLEQSYGEAPQGVGLTGDQVLFEIWASEKGTWTMLLTSPDGKSCVIAVGQNWQGVPKKVAPVGDPT